MMEWGWLAALEASGVAGPDSEWRSHTLTLEGRGGEALALCPLYLRDNSDGEYFWYGPFERAGMLRGGPSGPRAVIAVPWTPVPGFRVLTGEAGSGDRAALLEAMAQAVLQLAAERAWASVHLLFCSAEEEAAFQRAGFFARRSCQFQWRNQDRRPGRPFEEYLQELSRSRRNSVRRERRALEEAGIEVRHESGELIDFESFWEDYRWTARRNECEEPPLPKSFFVELAGRFSHRVEFAVARRGGEVLGLSLNLRGADGSYYGRYWGAESPPPFLHFEVALYSGIRRCLELGLAHFDPGYGGEHKAARGFGPHAVYSAHWYADVQLHRGGRAFAVEEAAWVGTNHLGD